MTSKAQTALKSNRRQPPKVSDGREQRSKKTKAKIQASAEALFANNDFASVTVESIVASAGVSKGTFYLHFDHKEDLLLAYAERRLRHAASILPDVLMRPTIREAVAEMVDVVLKGRPWTPELVRVILIELETSYHRLHSHDLRQLLLPLIELGVGRGELRSDIPPSTLASFVADAIYNALRNWGMEGTDEKLDTELDHAVTLSLDAICKQ
ncbi:MAG: TetR/AcrR family transcriptional regulator [Deltaproteobacteria bacterium]|nr:TetR/AcrR family transcriptional regulator [Deltaproteobacteria bacterium]